MNKKFLCCLVSLIGTVLLTAANGYTYGGYGDNVNSACAPLTPYSVGDCNLCHSSSAARNAYKAGGNALINYFCSPTCTDNDNDTFATEGGDCGAIDCDDTNPAINPGATENCNDNIDNNCNGLVDELDPAAVGCLVCTDNDGDTYATEGGDCGVVDCNDNNASIHPNAFDIPNNGIDEDCSGGDTVDPTILDTDGDGYTQANDCDDTNSAINPGAFDIPNNGIDENCDGVDSIDTAGLDSDGDGFTPAEGDCNDTDAAIHPDAIEICTDSIDNNCNGLVDILDPGAANCPVNCVDVDSDTYAINGGACGPVDCNDGDASVNPGSEEICDDFIDNDCDGSVDEGCDVTCADFDGDGYQDAACGGSDCDDTDAAINPASTEVCGNSVDENCNGASDDACLTCEDGTLPVITKMKLHKNKKNLYLKGYATARTKLSIIDTDTEKVLKKRVRVNKRGKWATKIRDRRKTINSITVMTSTGCSVDALLPDREDQQVNGGKDRDDDDDHDDDHDDHDDHDD